MIYRLWLRSDGTYCDLALAVEVRRERNGKRSRRSGTSLMSSNPHLAGGENKTLSLGVVLVHVCDLLLGALQLLSMGKIRQESMA